MSGICSSTAGAAAALDAGSSSFMAIPPVIRVISRWSRSSLLLYSRLSGTGIVVLDKMNWSVAASKGGRPHQLVGGRIRSRQVLFSQRCSFRP